MLATSGEKGFLSQKGEKLIGLPEPGKRTAFYTCPNMLQLRDANSIMNGDTELNPLFGGTAAFRLFEWELGRVIN